MSFRLTRMPANVRAAAAGSPRRGDHHGPSLAITRGRGTGRDERVGTDCLIGRAGGADVLVEDPSVSRRHARVVFQDGMYVLYDVGSRNGTYVNGRPVKAVVLDDGDVIRLGRAELVFRWGATSADPTAAPARPPEAAWASGPAVRSASFSWARPRARHHRRKVRP